MGTQNSGIEELEDCFVLDNSQNNNDHVWLDGCLENCKVVYDTAVTHLYVLFSKSSINVVYFYSGLRPV